MIKRLKLSNRKSKDLSNICQRASTQITLAVTFIQTKGNLIRMKIRGKGQAKEKETGLAAGIRDNPEVGVDLNLHLDQNPDQGPDQAPLQGRTMKSKFCF